MIKPSVWDAFPADNNVTAAVGIDVNGGKVSGLIRTIRTGHADIGIVKCRDIYRNIIAVCNRKRAGCATFFGNVFGIIPICGRNVTGKFEIGE